MQKEKPRYTCYITQKEMQELCTQGSCILTKQHHYISTVIRLKQGDALSCMAHSGIIATVSIATITKKDIHIVLKEYHTKEPAPYSITLALANTKQLKKTWLLEKCVELQVKTIALWQAERSNTKLEYKISWQETLENAATQCGNPFIPTIELFSSLQELLLAFKTRGIHPLFFYEDTTKAQRLTPNVCNAHSQALACIIGPEGGFSPKELVYLTDNAIPSYALGTSLLRYETAALVALSTLYILNDAQGLSL